MDKFYKIRDKKTGLFSTGGETPNFNKNGKIWKKDNHLHNHLGCVRIGYNDCEVVTYETKEILTESVSLRLEGVKERKRIILEEYNRKREKRIQEEKMRKYLELKEELNI